MCTHCTEANQRAQAVILRNVTTPRLWAMWGEALAEGRREAGDRIAVEIRDRDTSTNEALPTRVGANPFRP